MQNQPESTRRLDIPDLRNAEIALKRAAEKVQREAREAGLEPVVGREDTKAEDVEGEG